GRCPERGGPAWWCPRVTATARSGPTEALAPSSDRLAQRCQLPRAGAQRQLQRLRPQVVAVDRIVDVHPDAAVEVLRGIGDAVTRLRRPELRHAHLVTRRQAGG